MNDIKCNLSNKSKSTPEGDYIVKITKLIKLFRIFPAIAITILSVLSLTIANKTCLINMKC